MALSGEIAGARSSNTLLTFARLVVVCKTKQHAELAEQDVRKYLARLGLELHPDKTRRVELYDGEQGFDFLGCHFRKRLSGAILERRGRMETRLNNEGK